MFHSKLQSTPEFYQPQDGAEKPRKRLAEMLPRRKKLPGEPEDARLTGGTRSLMRRLSGLNLGLRRRPSPVATVHVA